MDPFDFESIIHLMNNGFTLKETLQLIRSSKNNNLIQEISARLEEGNELSTFFYQYCPKEYQLYFSGFIEFLPFLESISLSYEIVRIQKQLKQKIQSQLWYPFLLLTLSIIGVFLFSTFLYPALLEMMNQFSVATNALSVLHYLSLIVGIIGLSAILLAGIVLFLIKKKQLESQIYQKIYQKFPTNIWTQYETITFVHFFYQCLKRNLSTKKTLEILSHTPNQVLIQEFSKSIDESLSKGNSFEQSIYVPQLETALTRFMKIALYGSNMEEMLQGYLEFAQSKLEKTCKRLTRFLQLIVYSIIGLMIILMYQVLLLPLSIMAQF